MIVFQKSLFVCFWLIVSVVFSQDILTKTNGEDLRVKITEISSTEIRYKKFDDPNGPTYVLLKSEVLMVRYENGTKDVFRQDSKPQNQPSTPTNNYGQDASTDYYEKGRADAKKYYTHYKTPATWAFFSGCGALPTSGATVIVPIIMILTEPDDSRLGYPNKELMRNYEYRRGYADMAQRQKNRKVWTNFGIGAGVGCGLSLVAYLALIASIATR